MIEINLLQEEKQKRTPAFQGMDATKPLILIAMITVLGLAILYNIQTAFKANAVKSEIAKVKKKMTDITHTEGLKKADELQASLDKLNRKAVIIDDLITHRINWSEKLAALRDTLPSDVWIETIELETPKNPKETIQTLRIEAATMHADRGFARSAETLESLKNSAEFMKGMTGDLEDRQASNEPWDSRLQETDVSPNIWRFSFIAKRPLPESEMPQTAKKPAPTPKPTAAGK